MKSYSNEKQGQDSFYLVYLPHVDSSLTEDQILNDYTDGVVNGNILEFKLQISNLNSTLFQAIKYLSVMRIKGKPVPKNILLVSLNDDKCYLYDSSDYLNDIQKVYIGGASSNNGSFVGKSPLETIDLDTHLGQARVVALLRENKYTKIDIDVNCIVGWAEHFYRINKSLNVRKEDFIGDATGLHSTIGEIRKPNVFKDYINPYEGESNEAFGYLMDKLNDNIQKKNLGTFYTHELYAEKSLELVREAIKRVPEGNDYIILDRCAGTGNLELHLNDEELSHTILSTLEYYEYRVLVERLGDKVRHIIPPVETSDTFNKGMVLGADALTQEYVENPIIQQYLKNEKCTVIMFENPPYAETTSLEHQRHGAGRASSVWKHSYVVNEMRKEVKGQALNDMGNVFIWSAFKFYLRQDTDSYIVYSPVKYWKSQKLIDKKFMDGFAFNRRHFHTNIDACVSCIYWSNEEDNIIELYLDAYDIDDKIQKDKKVEYLSGGGKLAVKRIDEMFSKRYYDKRSFVFSEQDGVLIGLNGEEYTGNLKNRLIPLYSEDMAGYLVAHSFGFDNPDAKSSLLVAGRYDGNGFYIHKDNYLEKLPMFAASRYVTYNRCWTERARIMKSADGYVKFGKDVKSHKCDDFLYKCLLFTVFETQNHCREFVGSDERTYRNQFTLDTTNGDTLAATDIKKMKMNADEQVLVGLWENILKEAKKTKEYDKRWNYGLYQIINELDTTYEDANGVTQYNYTQLHTYITTLKQKVKEYYLKEIVPVLFKYEFLK
ncbi:MAG: hypothetical protein J5526_07745 [Bacteroidales bacterium]|nr:hypothetical protein [Bacteroidales bacterium]